MSRKLRIVLVHPPDESDASLRAHAVQAGLKKAGYQLVASLPADFHLPERIAEIQPDVIIVDAESDARDVLEHIVVATRDERAGSRAGYTQGEDVGGARRCGANA